MIQVLISNLIYYREIAFNRVTEELKQRIESHKQFDYLRAFQSIDDWSYGYVDKKNLQSFLRRHGHLATKEEVMAIIRRMDLDADARLNQDEFIDGIKPEEPYSKMMKRIQLKQQKTESAIRTSSMNQSYCHSRRNSQGHNQSQIHNEDMLVHNMEQRDVIRTHAMDRSFRK